METTTTAATETETKIDPKAIQFINLKRIIIGLGEIGNLEISDFDTNYNITRTIANLNQADKAYSKSVMALRKKYVKKDEKGNLASENNQFLFDDSSKRENYLSELEKLEETILDENVTKVWRLKASMLRELKGIKATTMAKCHEMIIDDIDDSAENNEEKK